VKRVRAIKKKKKIRKRVQKQRKLERSEVRKSVMMRK